MTLNSPQNSDQEDDRKRLTTTASIGGISAMRIIVPLQGIVQGRGGIFLGSVIPCALFYLLQLYLKRSRSKLPPPPAGPPVADTQSAEASNLQRSSSRLQFFSRGRVASVSSRALSIIKPANYPFDIGVEKFRADPYDEFNHPDGIIQLGQDDCKLSIDIVSHWVAENTKGSFFRENLNIATLATYQPFDGMSNLKLAIADLMSQAVGGMMTFNPSNMVLTAGLAPAIEILSFCLADSGNAFLVPTPFDPCFDSDLKLRAGIEIVHVPCHSADNFSININALERVFSQTKNRGLKVRGLLISNPSNPTGQLLDRVILRALLDFAVEKNIHIISNETFILCYAEDHVTIAEIAEHDDFARDRVHIVYGLSNDLSLPGFRVGVIHSFNSDVLSSAKKLARFSSIPTPTQYFLFQILSDVMFVRKLIRISRDRIQRSVVGLVAGLGGLGVKCMRSEGSLYCWVDMSRFLGSYSEKGEFELWDRLLNICKVVVMPGSCCHCIEPGWFRFNVGVLTERDVDMVVERIGRVCNIK